MVLIVLQKKKIRKEFPEIRRLLHNNIIPFGTKLPYRPEMV